MTVADEAVRAPAGSATSEEQLASDPDRWFVGDARTNPTRRDGPNGWLSATNPAGEVTPHPAAYTSQLEGSASHWVASEEIETDPVSDVHAPSPEAPSTADRWIARPAPIAATITADEPSVLAANKLRTRAVEAYCAEVCPPALAATAAAETLSSFVGGDDSELLALTHALASNHVAVTPERRGWQHILAVDHEQDCAEVPALLAARANGELSDADNERLGQHLNECLVCQAMELRMHRADRAFAGILGLEGMSAPGPSAAAASAEPEPAADIIETSPAEPVAAFAQAAPAKGATAQPEPRESSPAAEATAVLPAAEAGEAASVRRRRLPLALGAAGVALLAGAAVAALVTGGTSKHHAVSTAAVVKTPASTRSAPAAPRPTTKRTAPAHKRRRTRRTTATAAQAAIPAAPSQAQAPSAATPQTSSPAPATSSPAPAPSSSPAPASPSPSPSAPSNPSAPSSASPSIQQPSLGASSAPQGIGKSK